MHIGFQQIAVIVYVLFIAVGPKRIARWIRRWQRFVARLQRKPAPKLGKWDLLRLLELFEHSSPVGWALVAVGFGMALGAHFAADLGISLMLVPLLYVLASVFLFVALLLI